MLQIRGVTTGSVLAPVVLRLKLPHDAVLTLRVNGHAVRAPEIAAKNTTDRVVHVNVRDGLHAGTNRIRLRAVRPSGRHDVERRVVRLRASQVGADAGLDRATIVHRAVRVGVAQPATGAGRHRGHPRYRWRIVRAPARSKARLTGARTARPSLRAARPGNYTLRLSTGPGGRSRDTVVVAVRPDDPPIGVRLETAAPAPGAAVRIDGQPIRDTEDRGGIQVVVLDRDTRQVVEPGTVPSQPGGADQLYDIAHSRSATSKYLVIISSSHPVNQGTALALRRVFTQLGAPSDLDTGSLQFAYQGFTLVGNPAGVAGSATVRIPRDGSANITGYLRLTTASDRYDLVTDGHDTFDTAVPAGRTPGHNTMSWDHRSYEATLPAGATAGFQLLTIDDFTGAVTNEVLPTNGTDEAALQQRAAKRLSLLIGGTQPPLVLLQSIGTPHGTTSFWWAMSSYITKLGGNQLVFNDLDGKTDDYALAGRADAAQGASEGSTLLDTVGRVAGTTTRGLRSEREVIMADPYATTNTDLVELTDRAPQPFPAWRSTGEAAAARALGTAMGVCPAGTSACDIRASYYLDYGYNWQRRYANLRFAKYPDGQPGFTEAEFAAAKEQLSTEVEALNNVKTYFTELEKPFERGAEQDRVDLTAIANTLLDSLPGQAKSRLTPSLLIRGAGYTVLLAGKALAQAIKKGVDPVLGQQVSAAAGTLGALFSLVSFLTPDGDRPVLGGEVVARASELGTTIAARYELARQSLAGQALILVGDYGKLLAASHHVDTDWALPPTNAKVVATLRAGTRQSFGRALVPAAFPYMRRGWARAGGPPTPLGSDFPLPDNRVEPANVRNIKCWYGVLDPDDRGRKVPRVVSPFAGWADSAQLRTVVGFEPDGPVRASLFFAPDEDNAPSATVTDWLFAPAPAGLELNRYEIFDPRNYQDIKELRPYAPSCS